MGVGWLDVSHDWGAQGALGSFDCFVVFRVIFYLLLHHSSTSSSRILFCIDVVSGWVGRSIVLDV